MRNFSILEMNRFIRCRISSPLLSLSLCFSFVLSMKLRFRVNESTFLINELRDNLSVHHSMESSSEESSLRFPLLSNYHRFETGFLEIVENYGIYSFFFQFFSSRFFSYILCCISLKNVTSRLLWREVSFK